MSCVKLEAAALPPVDKAKLRRFFLRQRRTLSDRDWRDRSRQLCQRLQNDTRFQAAKVILAYFSIHREPDLSFLYGQTGQPRRWAFPRCVGSDLHWHFWAVGEPLQSGFGQIPEPLATAPVVLPEEVDLILVPCVACDRAHYRLGYGGGFYDRLLSDPRWRAKPTLGVVFDFAIVEQLPVEPWDQPLTDICSDIALTNCAGGENLNHPS